MLINALKKNLKLSFDPQQKLGIKIKIKITISNCASFLKSNQGYIFYLIFFATIHVSLGVLLDTPFLNTLKKHKKRI